MTGDTAALLEMGQTFLGKVKGRDFKGNCVFGFSFDDGSVAATPGSYCHGYVMSPRVFMPNDSSKIVAINTRIQKNSKGYDTSFDAPTGGLLPKDYFDEYYDFLFNRSVFADCYVTKTTEGLREGGVVVVRCDTGPANLMASACVAIRRGWEYTLMTKSLVNMLRMGIEPNLAHLVSYQLSVDEKGGFVEGHYGDHQSIYSRYLGKSGVENFRKGKLPAVGKYNIKTYQEVLTYSGLYGMWNDGGRRELERPLKLRGNRNRNFYKEDPFRIIVRLATPRKDIAVEIEDGLRAL